MRVWEPLTHIRDTDGNRPGSAAVARRSAPSSGLDGACDVSGPDRAHMWRRWDPRGSSEGPLRAGEMLRKLLLVAAVALLSGARATFHLSPGDPQLGAAHSHAQSHAQSRNNARPPIRTLNPASKVQDPLRSPVVLNDLRSFNNCFLYGLILLYILCKRQNRDIFLHEVGKKTNSEIFLIDIFKL